MQGAEFSPRQSQVLVLGLDDPRTPYATKRQGGKTYPKDADVHAHTHTDTHALTHTHEHARPRPANQARRPHARAGTRSLRPTPRAAEASSSSHALSQSRNVLCSLVTRSLGMKRWVARGMKPCISIFFSLSPSHIRCRRRSCFSVVTRTPRCRLLLLFRTDGTFPICESLARWNVSA